MELTSQKMRKLAPELDPLMYWNWLKKEDLDKVQVMIESTYGDSHPGSGHLNILVEEVRKGIEEGVRLGAISVQISVMARAKVEQTVSTTALQAVR